MKPSSIFRILIVVLALSLPSFAHSVPIAFWNADGNALDSVGSYDGSLISGSYATGYRGLSFNISGQNSKVSIGEAVDTYSQISISAWINPSDTTGERQIINNEQSYELAILNGRLSWAIETSSAAPWYWVMTDIMPVKNQWNFYALTYDGSNTKIYNSSGQVLHEYSYLSGAITPGENSVNKTTIGNRAYFNAQFQGLIDEVAVFDHALSANDVIKVAGGNIYPQDNPAAATPEPGTMLLMGIGAAGAAFMRRRKTKSSN